MHYFKVIFELFNKLPKCIMILLLESVHEHIKIIHEECVKKKYC